MKRLPKAVPLPKVGNYTEDIGFSRLGLPLGFDEERLLINLRSIELVRRSGGLGQLSVRGVDSLSEQTLNVEVGVQGVASLNNSIDFTPDLSAKSRPDFKKSIFGELGLIVDDRLSTELRLSLEKREEMIRNSKGAGAALDPKLHADYMDKALRTGLIHASLAVNADKARLINTGEGYGFLAALGIASGLEPKQFIALALANRTVIVNGFFASYVHGKFKKDAQEDGVEPPTVFETMALVRQTLFWGAQLDRLAMGVSAAALGNFVKARK